MSFFTRHAAKANLRVPPAEAKSRNIRFRPADSLISFSLHQLNLRSRRDRGFWAARSRM